MVTLAVSPFGAMATRKACRPRGFSDCAVALVNDDLGFAACAAGSASA